MRVCVLTNLMKLKIQNRAGKQLAEIQVDGSLCKDAAKEIHRICNLYLFIQVVPKLVVARQRLTFGRVHSDIERA